MLTLPAGVVLPYAGKASNLEALEDEGWLLCDGRILEVSQYRDLFDAIGYAAGKGNNDAEFRVPNYEGLFLRGVDVHGGTDPDKAARTKEYEGGNTGLSADPVCSLQNDEFKSHNHKYFIYPPDSFTITHSGNNWTPPNQWRKEFDSTATGGAETRPKNVYVYYLIYVGPNK